MLYAAVKILVYFFFSVLVYYGGAGQPAPGAVALRISQPLRAFFLQIVYRRN
jgi:hypothetical protein